MSITDTPIPVGLCQCGCGLKTNLAPQSSTRFGWVLGKPMRFVCGHGSDRKWHSGCTVPGCDREHKAHGYCTKHYQRSRTHGADVVLPRDLPLEERFWLHVNKTAPNGCWEWTAGKTGAGYGAFGPATNVNLSAHRFAYELLRGPIPAGLFLDHLCRNPGCVNPDHLEPVTQKENLRRSDVVTGKRSAATHCPHGHPYDASNTDRHNGRRHCRACAKERRLATGEPLPKG